MAKCIITEDDILKAHEAGTRALPASPDECIVTAQARDKALELGVVLTGDCPSPGDCPVASQPASPEAAPQLSEIEELVLQIAASLRGKLPSGADGEEVTRLVRNAVLARTASCAGPGQGAETETDDGVRFIDAARLLARAAGSPAIQDQAVLAEAFGNAGECRMSAGYLAWERASFSRVVETPEVGVVIEGELHLTAGGRTMIGRPGDMIYLPKGAKVIYSTPTKVKIACVNGLQ